MVGIIVTPNEADKKSNGVKSVDDVPQFEHIKIVQSDVERIAVKENAKRLFEEKAHASAHRNSSTADISMAGDSLPEQDGKCFVGSVFKERLLVKTREMARRLKFECL